MITTRNFCNLLTSLFFVVSPNLASSSESYSDLPESMQIPLTCLMKNYCKPISCGEHGFYLRATTPEEYFIINGETQLKEPYKIVDFFMASLENLGESCLFSLYNSEQTAHPIPLRTPESEEETSNFGEYNLSFFDHRDVFLGIISVEPHRTTGLESPHINYYILKEHQGNKYATPMISGMVRHLNTLKGKILPQFTLPNSSNSLNILEICLNTYKATRIFSLPELSFSQRIVGSIYAHVPLENPASFVPLSKSLFFTGRFHLEPDFSESLSYLVDGITQEEARAVGIHLIFSSDEPIETELSPLSQSFINWLKDYCTTKRNKRSALYPYLRKIAFALEDEIKSTI